MEDPSKKILILGCGRRNLAAEPRCQACSLSKWYSLQSPRNTIVTLDMNEFDEDPDIVANISAPDWMLKVSEQFGTDFDVIVDSISPISRLWTWQSYLGGAKYLLREGGSFYKNKFIKST
jgi:hypothetical protein